MVMAECPHCKWRVPYVEEFAGREVFCLGCGRHFALPSQTPVTSAGEDSETGKPLVIRLPTQKESVPLPPGDTTDGDSSNPKCSD